jgi:hypothetical protein
MQIGDSVSKLACMVDLHTSPDNSTCAVPLLAHVLALWANIVVLESAFAHCIRPAKVCSQGVVHGVTRKSGRGGTAVAGRGIGTTWAVLDRRRFLATEEDVAGATCSGGK